jgi:hypothetical protein
MRGQTVFSDVDPIAEAGFQTPFRKSAVIDATLVTSIPVTISKTAQANEYPIVSAITVTRVDVPSDDLPQPVSSTPVVPGPSFVVKAVVTFDSRLVTGLSNALLARLATRAAELVISRFGEDAEVAVAAMEFRFFDGNKVEMAFESPPVTQMSVAGAMLSVIAEPLQVMLPNGVVVGSSGAAFTVVEIPAETTMAVPPQFTTSTVPPDEVSTAPSDNVSTVSPDGTNPGGSQASASSTPSGLWYAIAALIVGFIAVLAAMLFVRRKSARVNVAGKGGVLNDPMQGGHSAAGSSLGQSTEWEANMRAWDEVAPGVLLGESLSPLEHASSRFRMPEMMPRNQRNAHHHVAIY